MTWPITQYPVSGGLDEEVASEKNNEFKRRVQKSIPYQLTKWWENGLNQHPIYDQNCWKTIPFGAAHTYVGHISKGVHSPPSKWR